jgi:hypothetical protein
MKGTGNGVFHSSYPGNFRSNKQEA